MFIHITSFCPQNYPTRLIFYSSFLSHKEGEVTEVKKIIPKTIMKTDLGSEPIVSRKPCTGLQWPLKLLVLPDLSAAFTFPYS